MNCRTSGAKRNKLYDTLLFPPAARCSECERLSFFLRPGLDQGQFEGRELQDGHSCLGVLSSSGLRCYPKNGQLQKNSPGRLRAHLPARYRINVSAEFHVSQHARHNEIVGFVANLTLDVKALKKPAVCLNGCASTGVMSFFTVRIE